MTYLLTETGDGLLRRQRNSLSELKQVLASAPRSRCQAGCRIALATIDQRPRVPGDGHRPASALPITEQTRTAAIGRSTCNGKGERLWPFGFSSSLVITTRPPHRSQAGLMLLV